MKLQSKQRLSADEKKRRFLDYFHETRDFFQLKELEKNVPKAKGIISQSIKDILQDLCSDNLVSMDKIGISNYYWSFPSDATKNVQNENATLKTKVAVLQGNLKSATVAFEELQANGYEDTIERQDLIAEYLKLNCSIKEREEELYTVRKSGSAALDQKKNYIIISKLEVEKLTDATISAISKISERFDLSQFNLRQQFDIPSDYEDDL